MKKTVLFALLLISTFSSAQNLEETKSEPKAKKSIFDRKHELKLGAIKMLSGTILDVTYEYINSSDFTFGSSVLFNLDSENDYPEDISITPFARFYFTESQEYGAKGFFVEGFAKFLTGKYYINSYDNVNFNYYEYQKKYTTGSIGLSLGKKWINKSGFVFETLVGVGRNIGGNDYTPDASFRGDLFIGYRF
jgi:hypothetical protein